ncbi:MAG: hypothetical protein ACM3ML_23095 [Micromonosporaceae bacterium]
MSQPYPQKEVPLEADDKPRIKGLVEEIKDRLQNLAALVSRVGEIPLAPDGAVTRFEVREDVNLSDSGVLIIGLPTDPPTLACGYYQDGEYTKFVVPCTEVHIGGITIDIDIH